jgi:hypothetical protein
MGWALKCALLIAALSLCVSGCGAGGKVYPTTMEHMHEVLTHVDDLPPIFGSNVPDLAMDTTDPNHVSWIVSLRGSEIMRYVADLEPAGDHATRMTLHLVGSTDDIQARMKQHPEIRNLYLVAMREEIDAEFEERPFDISRTYGAMMAATAANIGTISNQMDRAAEADRKRDEDNIRKAYANE